MKTTTILQNFLSKGILLTLFITSTFNFYSQGKIETKQKSHVFQEINSPRNFEKSFVENDFTYSIWTEGRGAKEVIKIAKFNTDLNLIKESTLYYNRIGEKFIRAEKIGNTRFLIFSAINENTRQISFYTRKIDLETLKTNLETINLSTQNKRQNNKDTELKTIFTSNGIVVYNLLRKNNTSNSYQLKVTCFDSELTSKWQKNIPLSSSEDLKIREGVYTQKEEVVLLIESKSKNIERSLILVSNERESKLVHKIVEEKESPYKDMKLTVLDNGDIALVGIYDGNEFNGNRKGTFFNTYNPSDLSSIIKTNTQIPIALLLHDESEIIKKKTYKKGLKKQELGIDKYFVSTDLLKGIDGGAILIAEHQRIDGNTVKYAYNNKTKGDEFAFMDILVIAMDKNGDVLWEKKIPKSQKNSGSEWLVSYNVVQSSNGFYFVFNDNIDNHMSDNERTQNMTRNKNEFALSVYFINESGYMSRDVLASYNTYTGFLVPSFSNQTNENSLIGIMKSKNGSEKIVSFQF